MIHRLCFVVCITRIVINHKGILSLLQAISSGLMEYWKKWSTGTTINLEVCQVSNNQASSNSGLKPIKLIELSSAFLVLGIGMTLATFAFMVEKISWLLVIYSKNRTIIII